MKKILFLALVCSIGQVNAQYFRLTYYLNGCAGNPLTGATKIYLYAGAGTSPTSTYDYTAGIFSGDSLALQYIGSNTWEICFDPYQIFFKTVGGTPLTTATTIFNFEVNFRDSSGNIFTGQCGGAYVRIDNPMTSPQTLFPNIVHGQPVTSCVVGLPEYSNSATLAFSPNPMHSAGGQFKINITGEGVVNLRIFNLLGTRVRTLIDHQKLSGTNAIFFNGCNDEGNNLPGGCYFYSLEIGDKVLRSGRLIILN